MAKRNLNKQKKSKDTKSVTPKILLKVKTKAKDIRVSKEKNKNGGASEVEAPSPQKNNKKSSTITRKPKCIKQNHLQDESLENITKETKQKTCDLSTEVEKKTISEGTKNILLLIDPVH